jgi:hypothetical protein
MRNIGGGGFSKMAVVSYEYRKLSIEVCLFLNCDDVFSSAYFISAKYLQIIRRFPCN